MHAREGAWFSAFAAILILLSIPPHFILPTSSQSTPTPVPSAAGPQIPPADEIQGQFGIIDVTTQKSCASISPDLSCNEQCSGNSPTDCQGFASILEVYVAQGTTFTYDFLALMPRDLVETPGNSGTSCVGSIASVGPSSLGGASSTQTGGDENPGGTCYVARQLSVAVNVSLITVGYGLEHRSDLVLPFAVTSHHSNSFSYSANARSKSGKCDASSFYLQNGETFYNHVRIDNMAVTSAAEQNQTSRATVQKNWGDYLLQSDGSCARATWDYNNNQDDVLVCQSKAWTPVTDPTDDVYSTANDPIVRNFGLRAFFDAPVVSSISPEATGTRGNYAHTNELCCGTIGIDTNDEEYCSERGVACELSMPMLGIYMNPVRYNVFPFPYPGTQGNLYWTGVENGGYTHDDSCQAYDENNDNCSPSRDDEADGGDGSICYSKYTTGCTVCDGVNPNELASIPTSPACSGNGTINTQLDYNLKSRITSSRPTRRFFTPMSEGQDDDNRQGSNDADDINQGYACISGSSDRRSYCSSACVKKFMQSLMTSPYTPGSQPTSSSNGHGTDPYTPPSARQFAGTAPVMQAMYKCIDDGGDYDDIDNTSVDQACVASCASDPDCNVYEACVDPDRPPLYDDCDNDDGRRTVVIGPERIMEAYPVMVGVSGLFSYNPNFANHWPSTLPQNIRLDQKTGLTQCDVGTPGCLDYPDDVSFCATDDEMCADAIGIGDQIVGLDAGTYVAVCGYCSCVSTAQTTIGNNLFPDLLESGARGASPACGLVGTGLDCLGGSTENEDDEQHRCNTAFPLYEDDGTDNRDDMHPSDPREYFAFPFNVCPLGPKDRTGLFAVDQETYTSDKLYTRFRASSTAEAFGFLLPYCSAYTILEPTPYYYVQVTVTDNTPGSTTPPQVITLTPETVGLIKTSPSGTNAPINNIYAEIVTQSSPSGKIGTDINGMIIICNGTNDGWGGNNALSSFNMAVNYDPDDPNVTQEEFFQQFQNPWRYLAEQSAIFWEGSARQILIGRGYPNAHIESLSELGGMLPIKEVMLNLPHVRPGSWWFYVDPIRAQTVHTGCKGLAMNPQFLANDANAQTTCAGDRHKCVPGFIEGFDWLLQQRFYDSDISAYSEAQCSSLGIGDNDIRLNNVTQRKCGKISGNGGLYERYLRDTQLTEYTPAVTSGRLLDIVSETSCADYKTLLDDYRHMPPGFIQDPLDDGTTCAEQGIYPLQFIQGGHLFYDDPSVQSETDIFTFVKLAIADSIMLKADAEFSDGVILNPPAPTCVVGSQSTTGALKAYIKNTGTITGSYTLSAQCDNGVTVVTEASATLESGQEIQLALSLHQAGNGSATSSTCTLVLGTPVIPGFVFSSLVITDCVVTAQSNPNIIASNGTTDACQLYGTNCGGDGSAGTAQTLQEEQEDADINTLLVLLLIILVLSVLFLALFCGCRKLSFSAYRRELMNKKISESFSAQSASIQQQKEDAVVAQSFQMQENAARHR